MKTPLICLLVLVSFTTFAQRNPPVEPRTETTPFAIVERGDHHRLWQSITVETIREGKEVYWTNSYTELEIGMHVRQPDGSYVEASDEIEITGTGAIAQKARHQVAFAGNCNSPVAIEMLTADGKRLRSRILGLSYFDSATDQSVLIAEIKDSDGQLLLDSRNEVIYYDAFTDFKADVRYKNSKAGLEQDIILRENPPSPSEYNLNPATTRLQVLTEFFNPPVPEKRQQLINGVVDEFLDFGDQKMGRGRVYVLGNESTEIPVTKQWSTLDGRIFLVEEIPYDSVEAELKALPTKTASLTPSLDGVRHQVSVRRLLPSVKLVKKTNPPMKLASAPLSGKGVVLDYITASSTNDYTFQGDTTYYVSGAVNLTGTNTTFEAGTVIKYSPTNTPKLNITSPITWQGSAYRPVVLTARSDNTVGDTVSGSTGNPYTNYFANPALYIDGAAAGTNAILQNLRIAFAQSAIVFSGRTGHVVSHAQLINCANGIAATNAEFSLRNALLYNVQTNFNGSSATGRCEHLTINIANRMNNNSAITLTMTNSLLVNVTNTGTYTSNLVSTVTPSAFQTVGAGSHYLADNTYRNAGTTNINASLAADLKKLTTFPPIELTSNFTIDTTLSPQAGRDTDTPDLGWHYAPLDYGWAGLIVTNAALQLTNGVAVGTLPGTSVNSAMLYVRLNAKFITEGSATQPNILTRYNTVQEKAVTNLINNATFAYVEANAAAEIRCRFTDWSALSGSGDHMIAYNNTIKFTDCRFSSSQVFLKGCAVGVTNCLFDRAMLDLKDDGLAVDRFLYNNLWRGGKLWLVRDSTGACQVRDNLFDQTTHTQSGTITHDHNGYVTNYSRLSPNGTGDVILTNIPVYLTNWLGKYYYPTNDGMLSRLLNVGSRNATNAGLYHYTVTTNQVKETNSWVDIGFHYVATDTNGIPMDIDGDGLPDYQEDSNGNGTREGSETYFNNPDSDGDGIPDGWEAQLATNPLVDDAGQQASRINYAYDLVGWLKTVLGIRVETISLDAEGNVSGVTP